ncbi:hypothetical protein ACFQDE_12650 [Deinococcus caeni]|uniref:hypothetical protein n=1 Tax=Deinococcus caeni TaxID=569127 RepID=UPI0036242087
MFIAATVLLMAFTPALSALADALGRRLPAPAPAGAAGGSGAGGSGAGGSGPEERGAHGLPVAGRVVFAGYGAHARRAARALSRAGVPYSVITRNPDGASELEGRGRRS